MCIFVFLCILLNPEPSLQYWENITTIYFFSKRTWNMFLNVETRWPLNGHYVVPILLPDWLRQISLYIWFQKVKKLSKKKNTKYFFHVATYEQTFPWKSKIYLQLFFFGKNIIFILTCRDSSLSPNDKAYIWFQLYLSQLVEKVCLRSYVQRAASLYMKKNILYSFDIFSS